MATTRGADLTDVELALQCLTITASIRRHERRIALLKNRLAAAKCVAAAATRSVRQHEQTTKRVMAVWEQKRKEAVEALETTRRDFAMAQRRDRARRVTSWLAQCSMIACAVLVAILLSRGLTAF